MNAAGRPAAMRAAASSAAAAVPDVKPSGQQAQVLPSSLPASRADGEAAAPDSLAHASTVEDSGDMPAGGAHVASHPGGHGQSDACGPGEQQTATATAAARPHAAPLNGRQSGQPFSKSLGLGKRSVLGQIPAHLANNVSTPAGTARSGGAVHSAKHTPHAPASSGEVGSAAAKGLDGGLQLKQAPSSGPRIQPQAGGLMGSGTPTYRVSGLRRSNGPRLHSSIGGAK